MLAGSGPRWEGVTNDYKPPAAENRLLTSAAYDAINAHWRFRPGRLTMKRIPAISSQRADAEPMPDAATMSGGMGNGRDNG
jgi:hypothetical protein